MVIPQGERDGAIPPPFFLVVVYYESCIRITERCRISTRNRLRQIDTEVRHRLEDRRNERRSNSNERCICQCAIAHRADNLKRIVSLAETEQHEPRHYLVEHVITCERADIAQSEHTPHECGSDAEYEVCNDE